jgi:zinc protease
VLGNYVFGSGPSSRLFNRIRDREGLSYGVGSSFGAPAKSDGARFSVNAIAAPQNAARVEESFRDELATVLRDGYGDEELETAKESWSQGRQIGRSQDAGVANMLAGAAHEGRTLAWDAQLEERVRALNVREVRDAMRRHLDLTQMTFIKSGDFAGAAGSASAAGAGPPSARERHQGSKR